MKQQLGRLAKNTVVYGAGDVLNRFIAFLLLPLFTYFLTPTDYGVASLLWLLGFVLTPVFSLGFGAALGACYFEGDNQERKETTIWTAFLILSLSCTTLAILGTVFSVEISELMLRSADHGYLVTILILSTSFAILGTPLRLHLQFEERAKTAVAVTIAVTLVSVALSIILIVVLRRGVRGMIESSLIAQIFSIVLLLTLTVPKLRIRINWGLGKELLRLGVPLIPAFAFVFVIQHGNKYILQFFEGLEVVGVYTIGFNVGLLVGIIVTGFQTAWMPYFMSFLHKQDEAHALFGRILTYYIFAIGSLSLLFFVVAKPLVMIMTQPGFHEAYKVVGLSATAQCLTGVFSIFLPAVYFAKEVKYIGFVQLVAAIIAILLNLLLIPPLGLLGAGLALMFGMLAMAGFQQLWNFRNRGRYFRVRYEWNRIILFSLLYFCCMILALWGRSFSVLTEILISCILASIVSLGLFLLLNRTEKRSLQNLLQEVATKTFGRGPFARYRYES